MMAQAPQPGAVQCRITCNMPGGYHSPLTGQLVAGETRVVALPPSEIERLQRQFPGRLSITSNGQPAPAPVPKPRIQRPAAPRPRFSEPEPYYGTNADKGRELLCAETASIEWRSGRLATEYERLTACLDRSLHVLTVVENFGLGGAEWTWHEVAAHADPAVAQHRLAILGRGGELADRCVADGLDVARKPARGAWRPWLGRQYAWADVVECPFPSFWRTYPFPPDDVALVAAKHNCRPGVGYDGLARQPDAFFCVSRAAARALGNDCPDVPRVVIPSGVAPAGHLAGRKATRAMFDLPEDATVCVWVGRLHAEEKGVPLLRRAISEVAGVTWLVVGCFADDQGAKREAWEAFIAGKPVVWLPEVMPWQTTSCYAAADIAVSTSTSEGLGLTLIEAGLAGLPLVATDSGGSREMVKAGATGYLSPPGRDEQFLANLGIMVNLPAHARRDIGSAAKAFARAKFTHPEAARERAVEYAAAQAARAPDERPSDASVALRTLLPSSPIAPVWELPRAEKPLRIAFLTEMPTIGGLIWRCAQTALGLKRMGHTVKIFYHKPAFGADLVPWLKANTVAHQIGSGAEDDMLAALRKWRPDVVHRAWPPHGGVEPVDVPWSKVAWFAGPSAARAMGNRTQIDHVDRWVLVSDALWPHFPSHLHHRAIVIRNAIPPPVAIGRDAARQALGLRRHDFAVLWAGGRLNDDNKGVARAVALLDSVPGMVLLVAGDSASAGKVGTSLRENPRAVFCDALRPWEMPALYAAADVFLQVSKHEGLSVALLEAAHEGLPVVATAVGGTAEVLGDHGRLFNPDEPAAAAELLNDLRDRRDERERMGAKLQLRVRAEYDWAAYLRAYSDLYAGLAEEVAR